MNQESVERSAKTVEEAIEIATRELDADPDEVVVDVISKGRSGILGIRAEPARVRVTRITTDGGGAGAALKVVSRILRGMGVQARPTILSSGSGPDDPAVIDVQGEDAGLLIGRRGETLQALQFIVNIVVPRPEGLHAPIVVDVEKYRERRRRNLESVAQRTAERVAAQGRPITLEPMSAADRRIIHMALADNKRVVTESSGEGRDRRITVRTASEERDQ